MAPVEPSVILANSFIHLYQNIETIQSAGRFPPSFQDKGFYADGVDSGTDRLEPGYLLTFVGLRAQSVPKLPLL